jgi:hypothetical protein
MSDSGVWGIAQEYFDKVYPDQEKRRRTLSGPAQSGRKGSNAERGVKKSGMGTDQRTNPPPAQLFLPNFPL